MEPLEKLRENLDREIRLHPNYPDLANMLGLLFSMQGQYNEAIRQYDRALGINPNYAECTINRAFALAALGRKEEALKAAEELAENAPGNFDVLVASARLLAWQGKASRAREMLEKAIVLKPDCPAAYHDLGLSILDDDYNLAGANFEKAASLGSAYIALYDSFHVYRKGSIKLTREAAKNLHRLLADNPNTMKVYMSAAQMLASEGNFEAASSQFEAARMIEPDSTVIENGLGLVAVAREYGEEAKLHFRRALQFDPANITAHVNLAFQLGADGELEQAENEMRRAVELAPKYPDLRLHLATILIEREEFDEAVSHLREALAINANYMFASFLLGSILFAKKRYEEVIDTYEKMDIDLLDLPEVYSHLATSHLETGNTEKAIGVIDRAISRKMTLPSIYVCQVIAYHRLNKNKEALTSAQEYMKLFPEGPEIEEIRRLHNILKNTPDS